ncbi:hypothetical protein NEOLEDRAFT_816664 [Neolentinus lepideus HHB14362 ss-1]|uniref:Uncharacterized protein n=1 Tax=Neolentinus lepideus HHB14362 ss-1 TaxID=1314782 RepID=A0A165PD11_9AGAM|nr:hypothetical protein NEOLEDRAFT_816664 [Neolentinus lepideus HHB14362 ss-1]
MDVGSHSWRCRSSTDGDTLYVRFLGLVELSFYWDFTFNGTADSVNTYTIKAIDPSSAILSKSSRRRISREHGQNSSASPPPRCADCCGREERGRWV